MKLALKNDTKLHKDKVEKVLNKGPFYFVRFALIAQIIIVAIMFSLEKAEMLRSFLFVFSKMGA